MSYNREAELRANLNGFVARRLGLPRADYYANLDQAGFAELKSVLSDINNIFTLKATVAFAEWLFVRLEYDARIQESVLNNIQETKPNANGFDVEIFGSPSVVAEVKCNAPINKGTVYGSAQRDGIVKDIAALVDGKSKSNIDTSSCLKFLVLLDTPEVRKATRQLVYNLKLHRDHMEIVDHETRLVSPEKVYITYVHF